MHEDKKQLIDFREIKQQKSFIKRRTKLIRSHWRNGIAGLESVEDVVVD